MGLKQEKVSEIVEHAVGRKVDIPEFQRPFVWEPDQVKLLAESLYRDYPIGSFLLWNSSDYIETKTAQGSEANQWVVDGQQRTTAMCILLGKKPYWWTDAAGWNETLKKYEVVVNIVPQSGERVEFALANKERLSDPRWFALRDVLRRPKLEELTQLAQALAAKVAEASGEDSLRLFTSIHAHLHRLWQIREASVPVIEISHEVEDVAEIFARLNREGTLIREADVILALAAVRNPGWVREDYLPFVDELEEKGWKLEAGIFLRTMTGVGLGKARLKEVPKDFWNPPPFGSVWKQVKGSLSEVITKLAVFGIFNTDLVPSTNSLIPLFVAHHFWKDKREYRFERLFRWFLLANRDGRYGGAAIANLDEDCQVIYKADSFDQLVETLRRRLRVSDQIAEEELLSRYDRAAGRTFLSLIEYLALRDQGAADFVDRNVIGYDKSGTLSLSGYRPQWHHIFPKSMLKKHGIKEDDIHFFGNITVLNEQTNVRKVQAKWPTRYIDEYSISVENLRAHAIPERFAKASVGDKAAFETIWANTSYHDFVVERTSELAKVINTFINKLR